MKMSYRDRVICLVAIIFVVILAGIFLVVKPITTKITTNKSTLATVQAEEERIRGIIEQIQPLENNIKTEYDNSKAYADNFAEGRESYQSDQFLEEYFNNSNVEVGSMTISEPINEVIEFYSYAPNVVTYPLLEAADINGDLAVATADKLKTSTVLSSLETQEVEVYSVGIEFNGKKDNVKSLLDSFKDMEENVIITNLTVEDYTFNPTGDSGNKKDFSKGTMTVNFYVLEPLAEPVLS